MSNQMTLARSIDNSGSRLLIYCALSTLYHPFGKRQTHLLTSARTNVCLETQSTLGVRVLSHDQTKCMHNALHQ